MFRRLCKIISQKKIMSSSVWIDFFLSNVYRFAWHIREQTSLNHTFRSAGPQILQSEKRFPPICKRSDDPFIEHVTTAIRTLSYSSLHSGQKMSKLFRDTVTLKRWNFKANRWWPGRNPHRQWRECQYHGSWSRRRNSIHLKYKNHVSILLTIKRTTECWEKHSYNESPKNENRKMTLGNGGTKDCEDIEESNFSLA